MGNSTSLPPTLGLFFMKNSTHAHKSVRRSDTQPDSVNSTFQIDSVFSDWAFISSKSLEAFVCFSFNLLKASLVTKIWFHNQNPKVPCWRLLRKMFQSEIRFLDHGTFYSIYLFEKMIDIAFIHYKFLVWYITSTVVRIKPGDDDNFVVLYFYLQFLCDFFFLICQFFFECFLFR